MTSFYFSQRDDINPDDLDGTVFGTCQRMDDVASAWGLTQNIYRQFMRSQIVWWMSKCTADNLGHDPTSPQESATRFVTCARDGVATVDSWTFEEMFEM